MRLENKQVIVAGQRPSDRSALVLFAIYSEKKRHASLVKVGKQAGRLLREAEINTGNRSTLVRISMFDPIVPRPSCRNGVSCESICPDMFDDNVSCWLSVTSEQRTERRRLKYICSFDDTDGICTASWSDR